MKARVLVLTALLLVLGAVASYADCTSSCLMDIDYVLCMSGSDMVTCDVVAQCGGGCSSADADCCNYYCAGQQCYQV